MMVKKPNYIFRDENAKELNDLLQQLLSNLEEISTSIDEAVHELTVNELQKINRNPLDLSENLEDVCKYFEFKTQKEFVNPIITDLRGILYKSVEMEPILERKIQAPSVKRENYPMWLMENVKPLIKRGITTQIECAKILNRDPTGLSKMVQRAYGLNWNDFVDKIIDGVL
jgi:hypothetical protein